MEQIFLLIALGFAAYKDGKNREIPIPTFPLCCFASGTYQLITGGQNFISSVIGLALFAAPFLIGAFFGSCGGGDILMFAGIGFVLGVYNCLYYSLILAACSLLALLSFAIVKRIKCPKTQNTVSWRIPLAPFAFAAYIVFLIMEVIVL